MRLVPFLFIIIAMAGCESAAGHATQVKSDSASVAHADSVARARQDSINRAQPGYVIDSLLPIDEEIRRFKSAIGGASASAFSGGAPSRDSLIALFARALERRDTATLVRALITPREFIDLYYPASTYTRPPYRQPPGFLWTQLSLGSSQGLTRLLDRRGGAALRVRSIACDAKEATQGKNRVISGCTLETSPGKNEQLFGAIIVRGGVYKFLSYANQY